jgi:hypothetical protein
LRRHGAPTSQLWHRPRALQPRAALPSGMWLPLSSRMSMPLERCACGIHLHRNACCMRHKPHSGGMRVRARSRSGRSNRGAACGMRHGDQSVRLPRQPILSQWRSPHQKAQAADEGHLTAGVQPLAERGDANGSKRLSAAPGCQNRADLASRLERIVGRPASNPLNGGGLRPLDRASAYAEESHGQPR